MQEVQTHTVENAERSPPGKFTAQLVALGSLRGAARANGHRVAGSLCPPSRHIFLHRKRVCPSTNLFWDPLPIVLDVFRGDHGMLNWILKFAETLKGKAWGSGDV